MATRQLFTIATFAGLVATLVMMSAAAPPLPMMLDRLDADKHVVCPIKVTIETDKDRVPYRIKTIKCANSTTERAAKDADPRNICSGKEGSFECVQLMDTVLVHYKSGKNEMIKVPVGCSCRFMEAGTPKSIKTQSS